MQLSQQQIRFYQTFGYLAVPGLFEADEIAAITDGFERSIAAFGGGGHDGSRRTMFGGPIEHLPEMCALLDDPRIVGLATGVLGEDFNYTGGDGNYYSGDTGWHPDGDWGRPFAAKIAFYLDPVGPDSGCLRVIPGSQDPSHFVRAQGIDPNRSDEVFGVAPRDFPGNVALATRPGDIVIFNHDLWHASFGGSARRRMFTMNLTRHCRGADELEILRGYLRIHSPGGYGVDIGGLYYRPLVEGAGPGRMRHLAQCAEIYHELFPDHARPMSHAEQVAGGRVHAG